MKPVSSFKKIVQNKSDDRMYFGQRQFDSIFQNQIKKGLLLLLQEDSPSRMHLAFSRYFVGSHHHMDQQYFIYDDSLDWSSLIPQKTSSKQKQKQPNDQHSIAWRYNENTTSQAIGMEDENIPELDLQSHVEIQKGAQDTTQKFFTKKSDLQKFLDHMIDKYEQSLADEKDQAGRKILIRMDLSRFSIKQLALFFERLRCFIQKAHVLVLVSFPNNIPQNSFQNSNDENTQIRPLVDLFGDLVFNIENIFHNDEYEDFEGVIQFTKLPQYHALSPIKLDTLSFGIKAKSKRKLVLERLYLAPDKEEQQETVCTSKPNQKPLEF